MENVLSMFIVNYLLESYNIVYISNDKLVTVLPLQSCQLECNQKSKILNSNKSWVYFTVCTKTYIFSLHC